VPNLNLVMPLWSASRDNLLNPGQVAESSVTMNPIVDVGFAS